MRERSLRVPDITLNEALEIAGAAEAIQSQLKQMRNLYEVNAVGKKEKFFQKKPEEKKKSANGSSQQIDWKFCGRKQIPDLHVPSALDMANSVTSVEKATLLAAKCTGGKQFSCNLHANQNMNYLQEDSYESQFEEYTIDM